MQKHDKCDSRSLPSSLFWQSGSFLTHHLELIQVRNLNIFFFFHNRLLLTRRMEILLLHPAEGDSSLCSLICPLALHLSAVCLVKSTPHPCYFLPFSQLTEMASALISRYLSGLLTSCWSSKFRFTSDHTASLCLAAERRQEPLAPSVIPGEAHHLFQLCAAAWARAVWDCWYWAERSAPGTIHQKRRCLHCGKRHE